MTGNNTHLPDPVAIEEWKLLSSIVARLEDVEYKMRSWLFALITGLVVTLYSNKLNLPVYSFAIIGNFLIVIFVWMDLIHRMPKRKAIERLKGIEKILREKEKGSYDGPLIADLLSSERIGKGEELKRMIKNTPYIQIFTLLNLLILGYGLMVK